MKYLSRTLYHTFQWVLITTTVSLAVTANSIVQAHPDDVSLEFRSTSSDLTYRAMSERRVSAILSDRLDSFPRTKIKPLARHLLHLSKKYRLDPAFVLALIQVESNFKVHALSPAGAIGLMQLMPITAKQVAIQNHLKYLGKNSLKDPFTNISMGMAYLHFLKLKYRKYPPLFHIAAYNIGPGRMDELLSEGRFKPTSTKRYYNAIVRSVPYLRAYKRQRI